jgi:hypothetical protein
MRAMKWLVLFVLVVLLVNTTKSDDGVGSHHHPSDAGDQPLADTGWRQAAPKNTLSVPSKKIYDAQVGNGWRSTALRVVTRHFRLCHARSTTTTPSTKPPRLPYWCNVNLSDVYTFGVYTGRSMKGISAGLRKEMIPFRRYFGFDSFEGLPEEDGGFASNSTNTSASHYYRRVVKKKWFRGAYNAADAMQEHRYPQLEQKLSRYINDNRVELIRGFFEDSLTPSLAAQARMRPALFVEMDADLASSTRTALDWMTEHGLIAAGTLIGYDDFRVGGQHSGEAFEHASWVRRHGIEVLPVKGCDCFHVTRILGSVPALPAHNDEEEKEGGYGTDDLTSIQPSTNHHLHLRHHTHSYQNSTQRPTATKYDAMNTIEKRSAKKVKKPCGSAECKSIVKNIQRGNIQVVQNGKSQNNGLIGPRSGNHLHGVSTRHPGKGFVVSDSTSVGNKTSSRHKSPAMKPLALQWSRLHPNMPNIKDPSDENVEI